MTTVTRISIRMLGCFGMISMLGVNLAHAGIFNGELFYTRYNATPNVDKASYSYNDTAHTLTVGPRMVVTTTPGADGIIFAPNGNLLVGGQGNNRVYQVNPADGTFTAARAGGNSFHLSLNPDGHSVWTSSFEGNLVNVSLAPFGSLPVIHALTGDDTGITSLAFVPGGRAFYVNGNPNNGGNFGVIDLTTFHTTRLITGLDGGHGLIYDSYTGDLILGGGGRLVQIDPLHPRTIVSSLTFGTDIDQISVDGHGHLFAADTGAAAVRFVDYAASGLLGSPSFTATVRGFAGIDDLAPLSGLGSVASVPEPSTLAGAGLAILTGLGLVRRARRA
jgi:hypothetical protein